MGEQPGPTPQPKSTARVAGNVASKARRRMVAVAVGAALLSLGAAVHSGSLPLPWWQRGDVFEAGQKERIAAAFGSAAVPGAPLDLATRRAEAERMLSLPPEQAAAVLREADSGRLRLVAITVWDYLREDGDAVQIESAGLTRTVVLRNEPATIVVPYSVDAPLLVTGVGDGGGGITLGVRTTGPDVLVPPFAIGATVAVPMR